MKSITLIALTFHVFQLLNGTHSISGVDVEAVTVTEVPQDVFGIKGRSGVINELGEAQRPHCRDFKPAALERQREKNNEEGIFFFLKSKTKKHDLSRRLHCAQFVAKSDASELVVGQTWKVKRSISVQEKSYSRYRLPSTSSRRKNKQLVYFLNECNIINKGIKMGKGKFIFTYALQGLRIRCGGHT